MADSNDDNLEVRLAPAQPGGPDPLLSYEQAQAAMLVRNYRTKPTEPRTPIQEQQDRLTYFSDSSEGFNGDDAEEFRRMVKYALERYLEEQEKNDFPINMLDFATHLVYDIGRMDAFKEARSWPEVREARQRMGGYS